MTNTGIDADTIDLFRAVFRRYPQLEKAVLFGSRAKGSARYNSDIDLALVGIKDDLMVEEIALQLEDLPLPFQFDVKALENIHHAPLKAHIDRVGKVLYEKTESPA